MKELNVQIAELSAPFPAKIFEKELVTNEIRFREIPKSNNEGGFSSIIYFVCSEDVEKTLLIREKVEKENAKSEENFRHPINKILAYIGLIATALYLIIALVKIFTQE